MMVLMGKMVILIGNVVIFMDSYGDLMNFNEFVSWFNGDVWMDFNFNGDLMDFNDFQWLLMVILPTQLELNHEHQEPLSMRK